jgi:hypothetical protein
MIITEDWSSRSVVCVKYGADNGYCIGKQSELDVLTEPKKKSCFGKAVFCIELIALVTAVQYVL